MGLTGLSSQEGRADAAARQWMADVWEEGARVLMAAGIASIGLYAAFGRGGDQLISKGLYGISRNPQMVGCAFYCLGFLALWPSWYAAGWLLIFAILGQAMIITEEEHLYRIFGETYADYCDRVPRYL